MFEVNREYVDAVNEQNYRVGGKSFEEARLLTKKPAVEYYASIATFVRVQDKDNGDT